MDPFSRLVCEPLISMNGTHHMSPKQNAALPSAPSQPPVPSEGEKVTQPVDWERLKQEFAPSPEVLEAVKQVFQEDAEILRQLA